MKYKAVKKHLGVNDYYMKHLRRYASIYGNQVYKGLNIVNNETTQDLKEWVKYVCTATAGSMLIAKQILNNKGHEFFILEKRKFKKDVVEQVEAMSGGQLYNILFEDGLDASTLRRPGWISEEQFDLFLRLLKLELRETAQWIKHVMEELEYDLMKALYLEGKNETI